MELRSQIESDKMHMSTDPAPCAVGEQLGSSGHCFHLYTSNVTWQQARETCQGLSQGDLAILSGQSITDALFRALGFTR